MEEECDTPRVVPFPWVAAFHDISTTWTPAGRQREREVVDAIWLFGSFGVEPDLSATSSS